MENRSLDDFLDSEKSPSESTEPAEAVEPDVAGGAESEANAKPEPESRPQANPDATRVDPGGVEPAASTYASGTGECAACGESVRERWRGEAGLVCPACKEW